MILAAAAGGAVEYFTGYAGALALGLVLGFIIAQLVPAKTSCGVRPPPP